MKVQKVVALAGGVGGAKLCDGLAQVLAPDQLSIVVNTADDFTHLGLHISPDLDTVCYTLAGLANPDTGWGRVNESWRVYDSLAVLGLPAWFKLGDQDLATHIARTYRLNQGATLSEVTKELNESWGVRNPVMPMSDQPVRTILYTSEGQLEFQEYYVHRQYIPVVTGIAFLGAEISKPGAGVLEALDQCDLVVICPSNPLVSIDPILSVPGIEAAIAAHPVIAVSPIIGGQAVKGPIAKMLLELGKAPAAVTVAEHYQEIIDWFVLDPVDRSQAASIEDLGIRTHITDILMRDVKDRGRLAAEILNFVKDDKGIES